MVKKLLKACVALMTILLIIIAALVICRGLFPLKYYTLIDKYCDEYDVDTSLTLALIKAESNFDVMAISHAGAKGLMQLTEETFSYCREEMELSADADIFSPEENIRVGVWYLAYLLERYNANERNAVAAYNAGASNVDKWLGDAVYSADGKNLDNIPFGETKRHVEKISRYTGVYEFLYPKTRS